MILYILQDEALPAAIAEVFLCGKWNPWHAGATPACGFFEEECIQQAAASLIKGAS
jgi:hypothetical protein